MTRFSLLVCLVCALTLSACGSKQRKGLNEAELAAIAAEANLGSEELRARQYLEALTAIVSDNIEQPDRAVERVEAYLSLNREQLVDNVRKLEAILASKQGFDRTIYEESFNDFLSPATQRWNELVQRIQRENGDAGRALQRQLRKFMEKASSR